METEHPTMEKKTGRGGFRAGSGRKKGTVVTPPEMRKVTKSICLAPDEWEALEAHAERIGARSVGVFASQILRQYIHQNAGKISRFETDEAH